MLYALPRTREGKLRRSVQDPRYFPSTMWTGKPITLTFGNPQVGYEVLLYGDAKELSGHPSAYLLGYAPVQMFSVVVRFDRRIIETLMNQGVAVYNVQLGPWWESFLDMLYFFQNASSCCYRPLDVPYQHESTHTCVYTLDGKTRFDFDPRDERGVPWGWSGARMVVQNPKKKPLFIRSHVWMILHNVHRLIGERIFGGRLPLFSPEKM